jgi:hypothetical protein
MRASSLSPSAPDRSYAREQAGKPYAGPSAPWLLLAGLSISAIRNARPSFATYRDELLFMVLESLANFGYVVAMDTKSFVQLLAGNM